MSKKVMWVGIALVLVVVILIARVVSNLDAIVASIIEEEGSSALNTEVTVSGVSIDLGAGKAGIAGLTIANPAGYSGNAFELDGIEVGLNLESLSQDVLVIDSINIQHPHVNYEMKADRSNNMDVLLSGIDSSSTESPGEASEVSDGDAMKMIIDALHFSGGTVSVLVEGSPEASKELQLPGINMRSIGRSQGGVTADVIANEIASELIGAIIKAIAKAQIESAIEKEKKGLSDKIKNAFKRD